MNPNDLYAALRKKGFTDEQIQQSLDMLPDDYGSEGAAGVESVAAAPVPTTATVTSTNPKLGALGASDMPTVMAPTPGQADVGSVQAPTDGRLQATSQPTGQPSLSEERNAPPPPAGASPEASIPGRLAPTPPPGGDVQEFAAAMGMKAGPAMTDLWNAAKSMNELKGKTPGEVGEALKESYDLWREAHRRALTAEKTTTAWMNR